MKIVCNTEERISRGGWSFGEESSCKGQGMYVIGCVDGAILEDEGKGID